MLICKYTRVSRAVFVPHLDILRAVSMGLRRAGIKVDYSEGFNPHVKIFFGQPIPLGTASESEYFCVYTSVSPEEFTEKLNRTLPDGVRILKAAEVEKDPNVAKIMRFADYTVTMRDIQPRLNELNAFFGGEKCVIEYEAKGERQSKDVRALIRGARIENDRAIFLRLGCGNANLRADRLMGYLREEYGLCGYDILKTATYDDVGKNLDEIFFGE